MIAPVRQASKQRQVDLPREPGRIVKADPLAESCRTLLRRLPWKGNDSQNPVTTIGLTSCHLGEGVTTIANELALNAAASGERKILQVDFNIENSGSPAQGEPASALGVADVLVDETPWHDAVTETNVQGLSFMPPGSTHNQSNDAIDTRYLPQFIGELKSNYDLVIADLPPAGEVSSVLRIGRYLDGLLIVVESERTRREVVGRLKSQLECTGSRLLGVVLNRRHQHLPNWLYELF
ncbi:CpsD/CapB family tyrosine-protein kinase [Thalassoroseus pseudoceratinae]|uniref:CpsD/CapB family tyrosine-protein kinase n=1 Tax=Thalassoroseus pseudoceratinae TaxID=2713176 RepID=UPI00141E567C|nr:CpsD/CapB family tyrosine-protein kinase [Thalassoroseus pseudoceratinae]